MVSDEAVLGTIQQIVGAENATSNIVDLLAYSKDQNWPFVTPQRPDFVVKVKNKKEIREILRLANRYKIPVIPLAAGLNVRGLCIPTQGGIILDMREMDKILEINPETMTATIQPGVNAGQLSVECKKYGLRPAVTSAPDTASAFANYMLRGLYHSNSKEGINHVLSMEIILPSGEVIITGSGGITGSPGPYSQAGGPDLTGLFQGVPGAFGVATEMTIRLFNYPKYTASVACGYDDWEPAVKAAKKLMDLEVATQVDMLDRNLTKSFLGPKLMRGLKGMEEMLPEVMVFAVLQDQIKERIDLNKKIADNALKELGGGMRFPIGGFMPPEMIVGGRITLGMLQHGYYHCFAFFGPLSKTVEYKDMFEETATKHGFDPKADSSFIAFPTAPWHGQFTYFEGELLTVDPTLPEQKEAVLAYSAECVKNLLDMGIYGWFRPYAETLDATMERWGTTGEFLKKIKMLVDPNTIMNPGRFIF